MQLLKQPYTYGSIYLLQYKINRNCATLAQLAALQGFREKSIIEKEELETSLLTGDSVDHNVTHVQCLTGDACC